MHPVSQLLKNATLLDLQGPRVTRADLRVAGGLIVERAPLLQAHPGEPVSDLAGRYLMPGLVCAHTHCYSALALGMPGPVRPPANFLEILAMVWWRLDRALDEEAVYLSAQVGALGALQTGCTTLVDHHSSPAVIAGSLGLLRDALASVGMRSLLCYEVSDRGGARERDLGLAETAAFLGQPAPRLARAMVGAHAAFTLSDQSLRSIGQLARKFNVGVHIHAAEDVADVTFARRDFQKSVVERLADADCLGPRSILVHGTHLSACDLALVRQHDAWLVHNPRSNMNNQVGYAPVWQFPGKRALGTDGIGADIFQEAKFAYFKAQDAGIALGPQQVLDLVAAGGKLVGEAFGQAIGSLEVGSVADLVVLDYQPPTELTDDNLAGHFIFGLSAANVESVMVDGRWVMERRTFGSDRGGILAKSRIAAKRLWSRMRELPEPALSLESGFSVG